MDIEENKEYEDFKNRYLQRPITFLTEENLDILEDHCRKAIRYERGVEHKVVLELLERYKEFLTKIEADKKRIEELKENNIYLVKYRNVLEEEIFKNNKDYIPKQKVKEILDKLHISDIEPWSVYKVSGDILFNLKEMVEDK